jgi:hypothetical protein
MPNTQTQKICSRCGFEFVMYICGTSIFRNIKEQTELNPQMRPQTNSAGSPDKLRSLTAGSCAGHLLDRCRHYG